MPDVVFVTERSSTELVPFMVVPVPDIVVSSPKVFTWPEGPSLIEVLAVRLTLTPFDVTSPVTLMAPVLFKVTGPPPDWLIPVTFNVAAVLVKAIPVADVSVPLKDDTVLLLVRVVPPPELVVRVLVVLMVPVSVIAPPDEVTLTAPAPAATLAN